MYLRYAFAVCALLAPMSLAGYASPSYLHASGNGLDEYVDAATGGNRQAAQAITGTAEVQPSPIEAANLGRLQNQLSALNANPTYRNLKNSEDIAQSLAENNLAFNLRQGQAGLTSPNIVDQQRIVSLLVPSGRNNHQIIATQPLAPIVVNQPGAPPAQISSGPPAVVRAAPVIYKIKPSVIYQQEVINKVPTPLSLNPVYVKVYKPGKKIDAPTAPVVQPSYAPSYGPSAPAYGQSASAYGPSGHADNYAPASLYDSPQYSAPSGY